MTYLKLHAKASLENISKIAYLSRPYCGGMWQDDAIEISKGRYVNIEYRYEYINRWGYDCSEIRIHETCVKKEMALNILEIRPDLKNQLNILIDNSLK